MEWADLILVMEPEHKVRLVEKFKDMQLPTIECLDISNEFEFMDDALIALIREGTETYLAAWFELAPAPG